MSFSLRNTHTRDNAATKVKGTWSSRIPRRFPLLAVWRKRTWKSSPFLFFFSLFFLFPFSSFLSLSRRLSLEGNWEKTFNFWDFRVKLIVLCMHKDNLSRWREEDRVERQVLNELLASLDGTQNGGANWVFFQTLNYLLNSCAGPPVPDVVWYAYHTTFGIDGRLALDLVDANAITCFIGKASSRRLFEVSWDFYENTLFWVDNHHFVGMTFFNHVDGFFEGEIRWHHVYWKIICFRKSILFVYFNEYRISTKTTWEIERGRKWPKDNLSRWQRNPSSKIF